jgi:hypothetical protein
MLGETQKPILPHPRSAEYMRERKKQIPISYQLGDVDLADLEKYLSDIVQKLWGRCHTLWHYALKFMLTTNLKT